jgi:alpha(1,3/1,4) fucosyltransferase
MSKPVIRLDFSDFGYPLNKADNFFYNLLAPHFDIQLTSDPDFLIFSDSGYQHRLQSCVKIYYTNESFQPNFQICDYALTCFHSENPRHLRFPHYIEAVTARQLLRQPGEPTLWHPPRERFCCFLVSNAKGHRRNEFFEKLSARKKVDSGGRYLNNMGSVLGGGMHDKQDFLAQYRFNLAFENKSLPSYTTEKLTNAMAARCIPIYWGDPRVAEDFNPKSFINVSDFKNDDEAIEYILSVDTDVEKQRQYLAEPCFHQNVPNPYYDLERIIRFFKHIFSTPIKPVSLARQSLWSRWRLAKATQPHPINWLSS